MPLYPPHSLLQPQLDHEEPSYADALARCYAGDPAAPGAATHPEGVLDPFNAARTTPAPTRAPRRRRAPSPTLVRRQ